MIKGKSVIFSLFREGRNKGKGKAKMRDGKVYNCLGDDNVIMQNNDASNHEASTSENATAYASNHDISASTSCNVTTESPSKHIKDLEEFDNIRAKLKDVFPLLPMELITQELSKFSSYDISSEDALQMTKDNILANQVQENFRRSKIDGMSAKLLTVFPSLSVDDISQELSKNCPDDKIPDQATLNSMVDYLLQQQEEREKQDYLMALTVSEKLNLQPTTSNNDTPTPSNDNIPSAGQRFTRICIKHSHLKTVDENSRKHFEYAETCFTNRLINKEHELLKVFKVEYIWNADLEEKYSALKTTYENMGIPVHDECVFHGTDTKAIEKIIVEGFKIGGEDVEMKNGAVYGNGVYTALSPDTCFWFAPKKNGKRKILLCHGIVADSLVINHDVLVFQVTHELVPKYIIHFYDDV